MSKKRVLWWVLFIGYCGFILWITLLNRGTVEREFRKELFWAFKRWLSNGPNANQVLIQYLNNIALFIPFGFLLCVASEKKWKFVTSIAAIVSASIEITQYISAKGFCEIDDVISNTLGALIGIFVYRLTKKLIDVHKENQI